MKSTYGLRYDYSYVNERFICISLSWKTCFLNALKIRIAKWRPTSDRSNQAIFYFDVRTKEEAEIILDKFKDFDFKKLEDRFDSLFDKEANGKNTGELHKWNEKIIPLLRSEFPLK